MHFHDFENLKSRQRNRKVQKEKEIVLNISATRPLMSIAHAVMVTISTVMSLMALETGHENDVKIIVRFN